MTELAQIDQMDPQPAIDENNKSDSGNLLTVVIPAYNEENGIEQTVDHVRETLRGEPYPAEIIVVDDGSTDDTAAVAESTGVRVIRQPENIGYGAALKAGILASDSEYICIIDADGTYPAESIPELMAHAKDTDMVVGARPRRSTNVPFVRRPAKWFLNRLAGYLAGRRIPDVNSGLRILRRTSVKRFLPILPSGFSFTTTITLAMLCTNHRVVYRPIDYRPRIGSSKIRPSHFFTFLMLVMRTVVLFNPLKVFIPLGTGLFFVGVAKLVHDIVLWNLSETAVMAFLTAIIIWALGLLADMVARLQLFPPQSE